MSLKLSDFDYDLPDNLIAQQPASKRGESRLLVVERRDGSIRHSRFSDIPAFLRSGDVVVFNDTKVICARLNGRRISGGRVEVLLLKDLGNENYRALIKPLGRLKVGEEISFGRGFSCRLVDAKEKIIAFNPPGAQAAMKDVGVLPLPPYVKRKPTSLDKKRYQTVFADKEGAIAAPTAGLHFTKQLISRIKKTGAQVCFLTLHVNYATFSPVRCDDVSGHVMEEESVEIPGSTIEALRRAKSEGARVFCVGTTVCKALEDNARSILQKKHDGVVTKMSKLFIYPPFNFKIVDCMITNFHLPRTTLLMLVSAFAGKDLIFKAYKEAIKNEYHFYSYGDGMLIL